MKRITQLKKIKEQLDRLSGDMQRDAPEATNKLAYLVHAALDMLIEQIEEDEERSVLEIIARHT